MEWGESGFFRDGAELDSGAGEGAERNRRAKRMRKRAGTEAGAGGDDEPG